MPTETTLFMGDVEESPGGVMTKYPVPDAKRIGTTTYGVHLDYDGSVRLVVGPTSNTTRFVCKPYGK